MADLTVGQVKKQLAQSRNDAQALLERLMTLNQAAMVVSLRASVGPTIPIPMSKCDVAGGVRLRVADYVAAMQGIVTWIDDLIDCLEVPDERPFGEDELV